MMTSKPALIIACGALAREITQLINANLWHHMRVQCIPAKIHNTPEQIPSAVREIIHRARGEYDAIFVAFADCGTGGLLDTVIAEEKVERLPGAHCYEFFAGTDAFAAMSEEEPGTFYLTDFLARHFDRIILSELGIKDHPELLDMYFGNYKRLVYLAQSDNPTLAELAQDAAGKLNLNYEYRRTDFGALETGLKRFNESVVQWQN
jgi:hypothetical protein